MRIHKIFPLIVYQGEVECHKEFKQQHLDSLRDYWFNGYRNESPEFSGKIFLHNNPKYNQFFSELRNHIDEYYKVLNVDYDKLSYHVVKSWTGFHNPEVPVLKPHNHNETNLSFIYYVKTDENSDRLLLMQNTNRNESVGGLFETSDQKNLIKMFNEFNCNYYTITPKEGTVVIFPADTIHSTQRVANNQEERIVIPGDIRVTLKPEYADYSQGSTHPEQWLELSNK